MSNPKLKTSLGEYNPLWINPADNQAYSMTTGTAVKIPTTLKVVDLGAGLHTQYLIDDIREAYSYDDKSKTVSTTPIATNVYKIVGNPSGAGPAIIKNDGTLSINGVAISFPAGTSIIDVWLCANGPNYAVDSNGVAYNCSSGTGVKIPLSGPVKMMCANTWSAHFLITNGQVEVYGSDYRYYGYALGQLKAVPTAPIRVDQLYNFPAPVDQIGCNYTTTFAVLTDGSMWAWGENTSGTVGNGQETNMKATNPTYSAPWYNTAQWNLPTSQGGALFQQLPVQIGKGVKWAFINRGCYNMYQEAEDVNGNPYTWGRNKSGDLSNGVVGTTDQQTNQPNLWDVLVPTIVHPFGAVAPPPPVNQKPLAAIAKIDPVTLPANVITLDGSASIDPDGKIVSYVWMPISGPISSISGSGAKVQATLMVSGTYVYQLTVTDNQGATNSAQISVVVNPSARTVSGLTISLFGSQINVPLSFAKFTFSDGGTQ